MLVTSTKHTIGRQISSFWRIRCEKANAMIRSRCDLLGIAKDKEVVSMRRIFSVLAVVALLTVVATPAMAADQDWGSHNDCDWGCNNDCGWWGCVDRQPFFNPFFFNNDCEWEFEEGWFWTMWGWQWGAWVLDC